MNKSKKKDVKSCHTVNVGVIVVVIRFSPNDDDDDIHKEIFFPENSIYLRRTDGRIEEILLLFCFPIQNNKNILETYKHCHYYYYFGVEE